MSLRCALMLAAVAASLALGEAKAQTAPFLEGTFTIDIYNGDGGGEESSPNSKALLSNPLITGAEQPLDTVTWTGPLNFGITSGPDVPSTIGDFFATGEGTVEGLDESTADTLLSVTNYVTTTVFVIKFSKRAIPDGNIVHDDGIGVYVDGELITPSDAADPTSEATTTFDGPAGDYQLVYAAANGNPSILRVRGTPETPNPDAVNFACRIDLTEISPPLATDFNFIMTATSSEKFCPENNDGALTLHCSGRFPAELGYNGGAVDTSNINCTISGSQCGDNEEFVADEKSIRISAGGTVDLTCTKHFNEPG